MSSTSFTQTMDSILAAWETAGQVYWSRFGRRTRPPTTPAPPARVGPNPKHQEAVGNSRGDVLLVWTEETRWAKGGDIAWQRFDDAGNPLGESGLVTGLPVLAVAIRANCEALMTGDRTHFGSLYGRKVCDVTAHSPASLTAFVFGSGSKQDRVYGVP